MGSFIWICPIYEQLCNSVISGIGSNPAYSIQLSEQTGLTDSDNKGQIVSFKNGGSLASYVSWNHCTWLNTLSKTTSLVSSRASILLKSMGNRQSLQQLPLPAASFQMVDMPVVSGSFPDF